MRKFLSRLLAAAAVMVAGQSQAADVIGAVIYARDSQYWQQVERGMNDAAKKYEVTLQVGLNRRQLPTEAQVIEDFVTRGVKAIVMPPLDVNASAAAAKRAADRGIVIVDFDTALADKSIARYTVGVDSFKMAAQLGTVMAEQLSKLNEGKNTVGLITLPPTNPNMMPRKSGLLSTLKGDGITIGSEIAAATPELGANAYENIIQRDPGTAAIWASNSGSLSGAAQAARRKSSQVRLYGVDMSQELANDLLDPDGKVFAVADQQPYVVGYSAIEAAARDLKGESVPRNVAVDSKVYTRDNPDEVRKYLDLVKSLANN